MNNKPKKVSIIEDLDIGVILSEEDKAKYEEYLKKMKEKKEESNENSSGGPK